MQGFRGRIQGLGFLQALSATAGVRFEAAARLAELSRDKNGLPGFKQS